MRIIPQLKMEPDAASVEEVRRLMPTAMKLMFGFFGLILVPTVVVIAVNLVFRADFERRTGPITTQLSARRAAIGDPVFVKVGFRSLETIVVNGARLELIGWRGSAKSGQRHSYASASTASRGTLPAGSVFEETIGLAVPPDIPVQRNPDWDGIRYDLKLTLDLPRRPDWSKTFRLEVRPRAPLPPSGTH